MASVSETELEQKTSEYVNFVREHFVATGKKTYSCPHMVVVIDREYLTLEYEGK